jgi:glycosyltransferase involved in cell wall biosynthesis
VFALPAVVAANGDQDGIPLALVEAMACGVPVISTSISGIPELLRHGQAGWLVPPRDADALADGVECLLTDPKRAAQLGAAGRRAVEEEFDVRKTSAQLRQLFAEAIDGIPEGVSLP